MTSADQWTSPRVDLGEPMRALPWLLLLALALYTFVPWATLSTMGIWVVALAVVIGLLVVGFVAFLIALAPRG